MARRGRNNQGMGNAFERIFRGGERDKMPSILNRGIVPDPCNRSDEGDPEVDLPPVNEHILDRAVSHSIPFWDFHEQRLREGKMDPERREEEPA